MPWPGLPISAEIDEISAGVVEVFRQNIAVEIFARPLVVKLDLVRIKFPAVVAPVDARRQKIGRVDRQRERTIEPDDVARKGQKPLPIIVEHQCPGKIPVVHAFFCIKFILDTCSEGRIWHPHGTPLVPVVSRETHVASEDAIESWAQVERGVAKLRKVDILCHGRSCAQE